MIKYCRTVALVVITACHRGAQFFPQAEPGRHDGVYDVRASLQGEPLGGLMVVTKDTVLLNMRAHQCRPVIGPPDAHLVQYECLSVGSYDRVVLQFDRSDPAMHPTWVATRNVRTPKRVCVQFRTNPSGAQVCARAETQYSDETVTDRGTLQVVRNAERGVM